MIKPNGWEMEFDEKFIKPYDMVKMINLNNEEYLIGAKVEEMKSFIHQAILSAEEKVRQEAYAQGVEDKEYVAEIDKKETIKKVRQETIEEIRKEMPRIDIEPDVTNKSPLWGIKIYNQRLETYLEALSINKKEQ